MARLWGVSEVCEDLGVSKSTAYKLMRECNEELKQRGYFVIRGKVPAEYLKTRIYGRDLS